jgi:hypothetical protein
MVDLFANAGGQNNNDQDCTATSKDDANTVFPGTSHTHNLRQHDAQGGLAFAVRGGRPNNFFSPSHGEAPRAEVRCILSVDRTLGRIKPPTGIEQTPHQQCVCVSGLRL